MHDVRVILDDELLDHLHRADLGDPPDIVPAEIEQHQMLGPFLRIGQQFFRQGFVFFCRGTALAGAGEGTQRDVAVAHPDQDFRTGADDREIAEIEIEQERRGIETSQGAVKRQRRQLERHREAL